MNVLKNLLVGLTSVIPYLLLSCQTITNSPELPNIVLIMADDMGYETVGCNGSIEYKTPNLDKLADSGIRFEKCFSQPLCTPSRVKIMTGKYNFRNYEDFGYLNPKENTFGNLLKEAGYSTCIAGKWQLNGLNRNNPGNQDVTRPNHFGFDEYCLWQLHHRRTPQDERYANPLLTQNGKDLPRNEDGYGPQIISEFLQDFIDRNSENPFFIYYPMVLPHDPFVPTPDSPEWADKSRRYEHDTIYFDDMIAYVDKIIGLLESKLKEKDVWENTLFIFTADNGTHPSVLTNTDYGVVKGGKGSTLITGNHVPMIINWPEKIKKGRVFNGVIDFTDILPTIVEAAGIDASSYYSDGKSFINVLNGDANRTDKNEVFIHYTPRWGRFDHNRWVMNGKYKLYQNGGFYNTLNDPNENTIKENLTEEEKIVKKKFEEILSKKEKEFPFHWNDEEFNPQK